MSDKKTCVNCAHSRKEEWASLVRCVDDRSPLNGQLLNAAAAFSCCYWQEREDKPAEYKPGDGPFWAWCIGAKWYCGDDSGNESLMYDRQSAVNRVDYLNRVCREWAAEHAPPRRRQLAEIVIGMIPTAPERRIVIGANAATVHVTVRAMERKAELDWGAGRCYVEPDKIWLRYSDTETRWQNAGTGAFYEEPIDDDDNCRQARRPGRR